MIIISILAMAARLILINQPYVDHWSWRQSDVATIARNFLQTGFRFGYPQIYWASNAPGYVGTEFPILPFIASVSYEFAGVHAVYNGNPDDSEQPIENLEQLRRRGATHFVFTRNTF
jgi:hypothetical protein